MAGTVEVVQGALEVTGLGCLHPGALDTKLVSLALDSGLGMVGN